MSKVFIAFQTNEDTRPIIEAILADNPHAVLEQQPAMVKINAEGSLTVKRASIEALIGRDFDLRELQVNLITLSGHLDEDDDAFTLAWKN
ncbi:monooxygenase [Aquaspirillum sp. LM1]|jgi:phenol hydroxylase P2 protein|uniref:MmoB/DmpM family protein n=1 Tax=Aquaspirillum sp. LM1 TaxID=1938604 RepID=UPI000983C93F|nr:MmoB/DmpM family protein [Aquaspirillum sp. LM1]AQR66527.1 monooxygenase [Aquaspirillum sp. LM1]